MALLTRRILITGSRDWSDFEMIRNALQGDVMRNPDNQFLLVSGACPTGADRMCEDAAQWLGLRIERHPADWKRYGKRAGFVRNAEMVNLGADICFAFIRNGSKGATHTAGLAEKAGIPLERYELND